MNWIYPHSPGGRRQRVRRTASCLLLVVPGAACQGDGPAAPLPVGAPEVLVSMREYRFDYDDAIPAGRVVFRIQNEGEVEHRLTLVPLPEDLPPIDEQIRGSVRQGVTPFAGVSERLPGGEGLFAVDLVAGQRYGMVCFVTDADGQSHAVKGMTSEFRAAGQLPSEN